MCFCDQSPYFKLCFAYLFYVSLIAENTPWEEGEPHISSYYNFFYNVKNNITIFENADLLAISLA